MSWSNIAAASSSSSVGRNNSLRHSDLILSPLNQLRRSQPQQTRVQTMETGPIRVPSSSAIEEEEEEEEDETEEGELTFYYSYYQHHTVVHFDSSEQKKQTFSCCQHAACEFVGHRTM